MGSALFSFRVRLVSSPRLAAVLDRIESFMCAALYSIVSILCWLIAIGYFASWCCYPFIQGLIWILDQGGQVRIYIVGVVWVILVWLGTHFTRIVILLLRGLRHLGRALRRAVHAVIRWTIREFGDPVVCAACVYFGVLSTSLLPMALVLQLAPAAVVGLVLSPLAAFVITARVFDTRAYGRWQRSARARLGARVLRAYSDGVTWGAWLRMPRAASQQAA
jgi:hypothetical protein